MLILYIDNNWNRISGSRTGFDMSLQSLQGTTNVLITRAMQQKLFCSLKCYAIITNTKTM